jgi:hypothetical protein
MTEYKLLQTYHEKPILTRGAHQWFLGANSAYLEVDMDVHVYNFIARKGMSGFVARLKDCVFENSFVVQVQSCSQAMVAVPATLAVDAWQYDA